MLYFCIICGLYCGAVGSSFWTATDITLFISFSFFLSEMLFLINDVVVFVCVCVYIYSLLRYLLFMGLSVHRISVCHLCPSLCKIHLEILLLMYVYVLTLLCVVLCVIVYFVYDLFFTVVYYLQCHCIAYSLLYKIL